MLERLEQIEARYEELTQELYSPDIMSDQSAYVKTAKQHRSLGEIVQKYREMKSLRDELAGAQELQDSADDEEMREMARLEIESLQSRVQQVEEELRILLIPSDPNDEKNVILEIRAGTGGDEATLFAAEMLRMYQRYAERQGWRFEILDASESGIGGVKEAIALIEGDKVYSKLKHESGVHRVQRVPQTETSGRIHTSAITVAVLPEAEEVDVKIDRRIYGLIPSAHPAPAGRVSTRLTRRFASRIYRRTQWSRCRTRSRRLRIVRRRCASCVRACKSLRSRSNMRP